MTSEGFTAKFCSQCAAPLGEGARFCSNCGTAAGEQGTLAGAPRSWDQLWSGLGVLALFLVVGLVVWVGVLQDGGPTVATAPRPPGPPGGAAAGQGLPADHPPITLTDEQKRFLEELATKAEAAPSDTTAWKTLAQMQARAAGLEPSYGTRAVESFRHLLSLTPDDPDTIRALANTLHDQQQYAEAATQYERYLELRPDDPNVRTDLATTYLYRQEIERAIATYQAVLADHPDFLQAHFNLGLAYEAQGDHQQALAAIAKARSLAQDEATQVRIDRIVEELEARTAGGVQPPPAAAAAAVAPDAPPAGDYRAAVEQQLRAHAILGPKITRFEWPDDTRVRVSLDGFPMDSMPDAVRNLFRARLETIIFDAKEQFDVEGERTIELVDAASGTMLDRATQ